MRGDWVKRGSPTAPVVVFVHGVLSNSENCWRHANGAYWPEIVARDPEMSDLGVYVFAYQTGFFSGSYRLADAVDALKEHLNLDGITGSAGLIFVCHSMGGIVVRKYLVSRATELIGRHVQVAIFLVASPSLGSHYADWLKPLAKILGHSQGDALRFVSSNVWLADLDRDFLNLKEQGLLPIVGKELIEDRFVAFRWLWRKQVVEPMSGARYFGEPYKVPGSDHFSIAKVEGEQSIQHRQLNRFIRDWRTTRLETSPSAEPVEASRNNFFGPIHASRASDVDISALEEVEKSDSEAKKTPTDVAVVDQAVNPAHPTRLQMNMGNPAIRHLIDRFWELDASDRREITLELGLISEQEIDLPEQERYNAALTRASERRLLDKLERLVVERE